MRNEAAERFIAGFRRLIKKDQGISWQERRELERIGTQAVKLGILTDLGRVTQEVDGEPQKLRTSTFYPSPKGKIVAELLGFAEETKHFIADSIGLEHRRELTDVAKSEILEDWLARAVNLYQVATFTNFATLSAGGEQTGINDATIDKAWAEEGFSGGALPTLSSSSVTTLAFDFNSSQRVPAD